MKKVAEKCGLPPSTLYAISSGDTNFENVGISTFVKIADALGMTADELYMGKVDDTERYALTQEEKRYRSASPTAKAAIAASVQAIAASIGEGMGTYRYDFEVTA